MMIEYWPWWLGALGLSVLCILYFALMGNLLGVSGSWGKVVNWRKEKELAKEADKFSDAGDMTDAFMAETLAEFGELDEEFNLANENQNIQKNDRAPSTSVPWTAHMVFLLSMTVGGFIAAMLSGEFKIQFNLSQVHSEIFGTELDVWLALLFGGIMVGFGTQMAGGCTSGHGLSGCSRLIPASLIATAVFMVSAIFLSLLMEGTLQ